MGQFLTQPLVLIAIGGLLLAGGGAAWPKLKGMLPAVGSGKDTQQTTYQKIQDVRLWFLQNSMFEEADTCDSLSKQVYQHKTRTVET